MFTNDQHLALMAARRLLTAELDKLRESRERCERDGLTELVADYDGPDGYIATAERKLAAINELAYMVTDDIVRGEVTS